MTQSKKTPNRASRPHATPKSTRSKRPAPVAARKAKPKKHPSKSRRKGKSQPVVKFSTLKKPLAKDDALTPTERKAFNQCETIINEGLRTIGDNMFKVGEALIKVREGKLYKMDFKTFGDYCDAKLNMGRSYAYSLSRAAEVRGDLSAMADILPANERQVRPLLTLKKPGEQLQAWQAAVDEAGEEPVTEAHVRHAVDQIRAANKPAATPPSKTDEKPAWRALLMERFKKSGFEEMFEQPVNWPGSTVELADKIPRYVKLIDELTLSELAFVTAMRKQNLDVIVVIDAGINAPSGVIFGVGGKNIEDCFDPSFNLVAKDLGAYLAFEGTIYKSGELSPVFAVTWSPAEDGDLASIGLAE